MAGLAAAVRLGEAGHAVEVHEARPFLGGRAASYPLHPSDPNSVRIDNCQHVLLRCCNALMDFYERCGVQDKIAFHDTLYLVQPGGRTDRIRADAMPAPLHLAGSLLLMRSLDWRDKASLLRCLATVKRDRNRGDIENITFTRWLQEKRATARSIERFWRPFVVSALNEEPDIASAAAALQVFGDGLLGSRTGYEVGIPSVPLGELYSHALERGLGASVRVYLSSRVSRIDPESREADFYVCAVPFEHINQLVPDLGMDDALQHFTHSPITGIHLWFDREITDLPHAMLLDRQLQWVFSKGNGYYLGVVSASRELTKTPGQDIVRLAVGELRECFPKARAATLVRSHVIKEMRATYSERPGLNRWRPGPKTRYPNVFLAGDWTATGWPATMEGAVRSGYVAARAVENAVRSQGSEGP